MKRIGLFFFLLILLSGGRSWGLDVDHFYDCDELLCMKQDGTYKDTDIDQPASNIGFQIDKDKNKIENVNSIKFVISKPEVRKGDAETRIDSSVGNQVDTSQEVEETNPGDSLRDSSQASHWPTGSSRGASQQTGSSQNFLGLGSGGNSRVSGTSSKGSLPRVGPVGDIRTGGGVQSSLNPALLNRQNRGIPGGIRGRKNNQRKGSSPRFASSGRGGSFSGDSPSPSEKATGKKKSFLSKLANRLGLSRYFGGGGSRSSRNFYRRRGYNHGTMKTANKNQREGKLKKPSDIIRENFYKNFRKRGLANSLEFENSQTSLFQKVCEHYDNYARSQNIPDNRKHCPRD